MKRNLLALAVIAGLSIAVYAGTLNYPFQFDDNETIVLNANIRKPSSLIRFFFKAGMEWEDYLETGSYRPFLFVTYTLNYLAGGLDPAAYRSTNILLHVINGFLVFLIIMSLPGPRAPDAWRFPLLAAALFTTHPVQTETVIYTAARSELLLTTMCLLSLYFYLRYKATGTASRLALSAACWVLALLTKESAVPFLGVFLLMEIHYSRGESGSGRGLPWKPLSLFVVPAVLYVPLRFYIMRLGAHTSLPGGYIAHWMTEVSVLPRYLRLLVLPWGQSVDHGVTDVTSFADIHFLLGTLLIFALLLLAWRWRGRPLLLALLSWPALALATEMTFPLADKMVEYRLCLPLAGMAILAGVALRDRPARPYGPTAKWAAALLCALAAVLGAASFERGKVWASPVTLWRDTLDKYPGLPRPNNNLGAAIGMQGDYAQAKDLLEKAIRLKPGYDTAYTNLGNVYSGMGRLNDAIEMYKKAISLNRRNSQAHYNLGAAYLEAGRYNEAYEAFREMAAAYPERDEARFIGAGLLSQYGQSDLALRLMQKR